MWGSGSGEIDSQWAKVLAANSHDLSLILGCVWWKKRTNLPKFSSDLHTYAITYACASE